MNYLYLASLLISLLGTGLVARRIAGISLRTRETLLTLTYAVATFIIFDLIGVALGIFATNDALVTGLHLGTPELPVEELVFLSLLCLLALSLNTLLCRKR